MSWFYRHRPRTRWVTGVVLFCFLAQTAFFLVPQPVNASGAPVIDIANLIAEAGRWIKDQATKAWDRTKQIFTYRMFNTALNRFFQQIAYETAVWIGSGDKGKKPLLYTKAWKQYLDDAADVAAGNMIETIADEWTGQGADKRKQEAYKKNFPILEEKYRNRECSSIVKDRPAYNNDRRIPKDVNAKAGGAPDTEALTCGQLQANIDSMKGKLQQVTTDIARRAPFLAAICTPPDGIQLKIALGLGTPSAPAKGAGCRLSEMRENWSQAVDDPAFLDKFSVSFADPRESDLGVALSLHSELLAAQDQEKLNASLQRSADGAFRSVTDTVSGRVKTPSSVVEEKTFEDIVREPNEAAKIPPPPGLLEGVSTVFLNTLVNTLAQRLQKGFWSLRETAEKKRGTNLSGRTGNTEVEKSFASIQNVRVETNTNFDIVSEFVTCQSGLKQQFSPYNCVLDQSFASALHGESGRHYTVREAMDKGLLHAEWSFGYADPASGREPELVNGYAASNMAKLRRFRIIPVGWELAAEVVKARNQRYSLGDVVDAFDDDKSPLYHLVDPDWVLKSPTTYCRAWGASQQMSKDTGQRMEYCADAQDCVVENENGSCASWGYCTKEKNVWRFSGDACAPQDNTCLTVEEEKTGAVASYLRSTWDGVGTCTAQNAGCTAYPLQTYNTSTKRWETGASGEKRFLTSQTSTCREEAVGCTALIQVGGGVNLVPNGTFDLIRDPEGAVPSGWEVNQGVFTTSNPGLAGGATNDRVGRQEGGLARTRILGIDEDRSYAMSAEVWIVTQPTSGEISLQFLKSRGGQESVIATVRECGANQTPPQCIDRSRIAQWQSVRASGSGGAFDAGVDEARLVVTTGAGGVVHWDDITLAEGTSASSYVYGAGGLTYMKLTNASRPALACTKDEVGCSQYTPENGDPAVAGVVSPRDTCPGTCVGYANFRQEAPQNGLDDTRTDLTFMPSTARACTVAEVGCDEFTNLDELARGGEGLTYFSEIRQCQKPKPVNQDCATFLTYEGSATSPYQLQSFSLKAEQADGSGGPATTDRSTTCAKGDPNCRDFIDAKGQHSFRDIRRTVTCSDACNPFRKTQSTSAQCSRTGGSWDGNACIYDIIPSEARQCRREANGCRAYVGTRGHVTRTVAREDFESSATLVAWTYATTQGNGIVTEAVRQGGHSLAIPSTTPTSPRTTWTVGDGTIRNGAEYLVTFLAKKRDTGTSPTVTLTARGGGASFTASTTLTASGWNSYTLGPITATNPSNSRWTFAFEGTGAFFLDDVIVRRTNEQHYLVKDTWRTPSECTAATLGCQAYSDSQGARKTLSSFTRSCAFEKVGCSAFINTKNSASAYADAWNGDPSTSDDDRTVAADTLEYLVPNGVYSCRAEDRGCAALETTVTGNDGKTEKKTTFLRDDPDLYGQILCKKSEERCSAYTSERGLHYFKNPGDQVCEYRRVAGSTKYDWFKKGTTSSCSERVCTAGDAAKKGNACGTDADCGAAGVCENFAPKGWTRVCPSEESGCTKFVDPLDTSNLYPKGYAYYYLKNDSLDTSSCGTTVDLKRGCVAFNDTSNPELLYDAKTSVTEGAATPACDTDQTTTLPDCTATLTNNVNSILKVARDRQCGEWLACRSSTYQLDATTGEYREICTQLGRCLASDPERPTECKRWAPSPTFNAKILDKAEYTVQRGDASWKRNDFSGHSLPNKYPVDEFVQITRSPTKLTYLEKKEGACQTDQNCVSKGTGDLCFNNTCFQKRGVDGSIGDTQRKEKTCRLYPELTSPAPSIPKFFESRAPKTLENQAKVKDVQYGFTAQNSDKEVRRDQYTFRTGTPAGYQSLEMCQVDMNNDGVDDAPVACDCSYQKAQYQNGDTRYYAEDGKPPRHLYEAEGEGEDEQLFTYAQKELKTMIGWRGYCLEEDLNPKAISSNPQNVRPCFTWYPLDALQGEVSVFSNHPEAGFEAEHPYYCLASAWQEYRSRYDKKIYTADWGKSLVVPGFPLPGVGQGLYDALWGKPDPVCGPGYVGTRFKKGSDTKGRFERYHCDPVGGDAWYAYNGSLSGSETVRRVCTDIAQIEDTKENAAWTSRIHDIPKDAFKIPLGILPTDPTILSSTAQKPYGAIPILESDPRSWRDYVVIPSNGTEPRPYSLCENLGDQQKCISLSAEKQQLFGPGKIGADRLQQLFARSYGVYGAALIRSDGICTGVCSGGPIPGETCTNAAQCDVSSEEKQAAVSYTCTTNVCTRGPKQGSPCAIVEVGACATPGTCGSDGFCIDGPDDGKICSEKGRCAADSRKQSVKGACADTTLNGIAVTACIDGPLKGFPCDKNDAESCSLNKDAACSGAQTACQGVVTGDLSGRLCTPGDAQFDCTAIAKCTNTGILNTGSGAQTVRQSYVCSNNESKGCTVPGASTGCESAEGVYQALPSVTRWDVTLARGQAPVIAAVNEVDGRVSEGQRGLVTMKKESSPDNGSLNVSMWFYAYNENGEQMPLRQVAINWGDDSPAPPIIGRMQNHKHVCNRISGNFGDTIEACVEDVSIDQPGYFVFNHAYVCTAESKQYTSSLGACEYKGITATVTDNWGKSSPARYNGSVIVEPERGQ